ncbi:E3 ubiquitin-protein ligase listerin [Lachnellula occidentalis]|uniref:E3 ubiquitin-protein ligase listerin n=1 Tax=Lachnellula occidentalis TaxID=215460 RepID=A0A8H8RSN6_9HELO|nr:E3 ubiquitin-protein ligase listerin [Lachnellula occidentalis]
MSKNQFKTAASSSRAALAPSTGFGAFGSTAAASKLSYLAELPNLNSISDPNLIVAFRGLRKPDTTTKLRSLSTITAYVEEQGALENGGVENPVLEAWVHFYPRLSIANDRRVREASHSLQAALLKAAGKRMVKYIPRIIGTWLAGCYDKDTLVSRAAQLGIETFLDTDEKMIQFWKRGQIQILEYAQEASQETPATLSDERNTAADDSMEVFHRVQCSSLSLVTNLLLKLKTDDIAACQSIYESYFSDKGIWSNAASPDSSLRRAACNILVACLEKQPTIVMENIESISTGYIAMALRESQSTTALLLLQTLEKLTARHPKVWDGPYRVSKEKFPSSFDILRRFVKKGSHSCPPKYWLSLQLLVHRLPSKILPSKADAALDFLTSLRKGIEGEPRQHLAQAWSSYFDIASVLVKNIPDIKDQNAVVKDRIVKLFDEYFSGESSVPTSALAGAYYILISNTNLGGSEECLLQHITSISNSLAQQIRKSLEVAAEDAEQHVRSQRHIIQMGHRWFLLLADILRLNNSQDHAKRFVIPSRQVSVTAIETIISEDGKAYSAAAIVEMVLRFAPVLVDDETKDSMEALVENHIPRLILSPSSRHLVSLLPVFGQLPNQLATFEKGWEATINYLVDVRPRNSTFVVLKGLIEYDAAAKLSRAHLGLQNLLLDANTRSLQGKSDAWPLIETAIKFDCFADTSISGLIQELLRHLNPKNYDLLSEKSEVALKTLECISAKRPRFLHQDQDTQIELITILLGLIETSDDAIAPRALKLKSDIDKIRPSTGPTEQNFMLRLIRNNLELDSEHPGLLFIETLVSQVTSVKESFGDSVSAVDFFPDIQKWSEALKAPLNLPPNPALGVMRPMAGAAFLAAPPFVDATLTVATEALPFSVLVRMALYTSKLVDDMDIVTRLPKDLLVEVLHSLLLTVELLSDRIDLLPDGRLPEGITDYDATSDLVSGKYLFPGIIAAHRWKPQNTAKPDGDIGRVVNSLCETLIQTARSASSSAYYASKAVNHLLTRVVDAHNCSVADCEAILTESGVVLLETKDTLTNIGILSGFNTNLAKSKVASNLCNKLVSSIVDASPQSEKTLGSLVLLNTALAIYDEEEDAIPVSTNRLVFAVRRILSWSEDLASTDSRLASEACHALQRLLPAIKDVYGTYWETALEFCISIWESDRNGELSDDIIPMVGMSLKLYSVLRKIQEPNDDLLEALSSNRNKLSQGLVHLLKLQRPPKNHKPLDFVDTVLLRELREISTDDLEDLSDFYLVMSSDNRKLQSAAFHILQSGIPSVQQQLSVDVLLEKRDAQLPDELLSLLLNSPSFDTYSDGQLREFPTDIRCYLLSWYLVYFSFSNASLKVQNDYADILKTEQVIDPLLVFLFDVMGHSAGAPLDLEKWGLTNTTWGYDLWDPVVDTDPERDMQWLLVNIWFMCLRYTPDLAKTWFLALKSKQTTLAVTNWTEKYFSPYFISEAKDVATKWDEAQEVSGDEKKIIVRVSKNSPNITVGYEIDELMMSIVMILPSNYPLDRVEVKGVNRVAVKESTWNGWMRTIQGATMFNNGTVADGLTVFKKNIFAALKGQTECSICYSIISSDKRMPDKRCQTCKNLFHANCLFKWFASSNASTCPMCRQPFGYAASSVAQRVRDNLGA